MTAVSLQTISSALGLTKRAVEMRAEREGWPFAQKTVRGGQQKVFSALKLPRDVREALCEYELRAPALTTVLPKAPALPAATSLSDVQRRVAEARMALLAEIDRLARVSSAQSAIKLLADRASKRELSPALMAFVPVANARDGENGCRTLSVRTLKRWRALRKEGGFAALAPRDGREKAPVPSWAQILLKHYRRPTKPAISEALEAAVPELQSAGISPPSYHQAVRLLRQVGTVERHRGRMGPRELKNLKGYVKRDDSQLAPLDIAIMDGHQFDAEVAHPHHGGPFRPEITTVIDAKTRLALGYSLGLAESAEAVMDAVRDAVIRFGVPAWLYSDKGSGYEAELTSGTVTGFLARLGTSHMQSRAYNSQARGRSERSHATIWVKAAKQLPTYIGKPMDAEAKQAVYRLTRRDLNGRGRALLMPWPEFVTFCSSTVDAYNQRPHRALPSIIDAETGKRRHQSPIEAWRAAIEAGFTPETISQDAADDLFRPHREAVTRRGLVSLSNLEYYHELLQEHGGSRVLVAYEPADPAFVWVKTLDGRLICKAVLDGHKRDFVPLSMRDQGRLTRLQGRVKRLETHLDEARAEALGPPIDVPVSIVLSADDEKRAAAVMRDLAKPVLELVPVTAIPADGRPHSFPTDEAKIVWMAQNPALADAEDRAWYAEKRRKLGRTFGLLFGEWAAIIDAQASRPTTNEERIAAAG